MKGDEPLDGRVLNIYKITPGSPFETTLTATDFKMSPP
jgi:hypothetical protein